MVSYDAERESGVRRGGQVPSGLGLVMLFYKSTHMST